MYRHIYVAYRSNQHMLAYVSINVGSLSMSEFDPLQPYNNLPALPPKSEIESKAVLKACIEARASLAELKQALL